jgi:type II secretory pathway pseudopilin PulG
MHGVKETFIIEVGVTVPPTPKRSKLSVCLDAPSLPARRTTRAFTILEVMLATIVMALVITTSITTMQRGFLAIDSARKLTVAGQILQCEMEKMRMVPWATIYAYPATLEPMTLDPTFLSNPAVSSTFSLRRDVAVIVAPTSTIRGMSQITFTVSWKTYDGRTLSRSYTTYYGEKGLYDYYYNYNAT